MYYLNYVRLLTVFFLHLIDYYLSAYFKGCCVFFATGFPLKHKKITSVHFITSSKQLSHLPFLYYCHCNANTNTNGYNDEEDSREIDRSTSTLIGSANASVTATATAALVLCGFCRNNR